MSFSIFESRRLSGRLKAGASPPAGYAADGPLVAWRVVSRAEKERLLALELLENVSIEPLRTEDAMKLLLSTTKEAGHV